MFRYVLAILLFLVGVGMATAAEEKVQAELYGFVRVDAIYDFKRMLPQWNSTLRPSEIPVPYADSPFYEEGEFIVSAQASRVGTNIRMPAGSAPVDLQIEIDFYGVGGNEGQQIPRLRHAWGRRGKLLIGQTWSLHCSVDAFPLVSDFWGPPGMMISRRPQLRWTFTDSDARRIAVALEQPSTGIDEGKFPQIDPDFQAESLSRLPDLTAQIQWRGDWGLFQVNGVARDLGYEGSTATTDFSGSVFGWGGELSGRFHTAGKSAFVGQFAYGEGVANYVNDGGFDLAGDDAGNAFALPLLGWTAYYEAWWSATWVTALGYGRNTQDNGGRQQDDVFKSGSYATLNLVHYPVPRVSYGLEFQWAERQNKDGNSNDDYRILLSAQYRF